MERLDILIVAALLAGSGCVGPDAGSGNTVQPLIDAETGAIRGVVVDEDLLPAAQVLVGLDGADATFTDASGAFIYSTVAPGTHEVLVEGVQFEPQTVAVEVFAQQVAEVTVTLRRTHIDSPYHETATQGGITFCGTSFREPGQSQPSYLQICGVLYYGGLTDYDRFRLDWQVPMEGFAGLWSETVWQKNSAASGGYNVLWDVFGDDGDIYNIAPETGSGQSPLQIRIERAAIDAQVAVNGDRECPADGDCHLASFHASYGETLGPSVPVDAALSVMQRYTVYLTKFYHGELPQEFTALGDS